MGDNKWIHIPLLHTSPNQCVYEPSVKTEDRACYNREMAGNIFAPSVIYDEEKQMCIMTEGYWSAKRSVQEMAVKEIQTGTIIPEGITFGQNANRAAVSQYTLNLLAEIMRDSGNNKIIITSTLRTAEDQARAMYQNIVGKGFKYNYSLYGPTGDKVIKAGEKAKQKGGTKEQIMAAMTEEIKRIGPSKVSRHAGDPAVINVVDIAPSSLTDTKAFAREIKKRGIFLLQPPADPAYHLEVKQNNGHEKKVLP